MQKTHPPEDFVLIPFPVMRIKFGFFCEETNEMPESQIAIENIIILFRNCLQPSRSN